MKYTDKKQTPSSPTGQPEKQAAQGQDLPAGFDRGDTPEAIIRLDKDRLHRFYSDNLPALLQIKPTKIIGRTIGEANYLGELSAEIDHVVELVLKSKKAFYKEFSLTLQNRPFWISIGFTPEKDEHGEITGITGVFRDINSQKNIEQRHHHRKLRDNLAAEASDYGLWDWAVGDETMHLSRKWKSQLGYYPDELENKFSTWTDLLHPDDYNRVKRTFENFLKSSALIYESEYRLKHKDGIYRWFKTRAAMLRDSNGKPLRVLGTNRDITIEKKHQKDLRMLHQAIMQSPVPIVITDLDGYIEFFNPAYSKITGYRKDELVGKKTNIQKSGYHPTTFYEKLWKTISTGKEWVGEFKNRNKNGKTYWELASISSLKDEQGTITNYLKISEEITSFKRLEEDLKRSQKRTRIENQSRTNFMANMSHEIRTPINGIIGFSELLKTGDLTPDQQVRYADIIEESSRYLLLLIDDIIDISKIEANELKVKKDACSLKNTFSELSQQFLQMRGRKQKEHIEILFRKPKLKHHDYIFTDTRRLKQILFNLFDNALKFTDTGHIEIGYQLLSKNKLQFYVEDTGHGIPQDQLKTIFNRTLQHAHSLKEREGGAGLGLAISNGLVKLLGGNMNVKSTVNKGSIFYFTIPYDKITAPTKAKPKKTTSDYNFENCTVLIAEDVDYNYEYLYEILRETKATVLWAKDGIDALNLFSKNKIDLILMDIQMPEIDGYEATRTIRQSDTEIPIIAQTAYAMSDEQQKCLDAGCNEVLSKPIKMKELLDTLASYLK
ncbi:PAS domain S-box protein [uncultured Sunxiuqinia sp.]|uniref:PAS domain-containing hybrid sensor histidine kinase/response regulator n=1 Tax=uncultured Sunxiuqinia sp. TaxID=1573825 RepID=UPI002622670D|nr:PAS domain S-box protein [uncultured Sunxiuqinia sp.]